MAHYAAPATNAARAVTRAGNAATPFVQGGQRLLGRAIGSAGRVALSPVAVPLALGATAIGFAGRRAVTGGTRGLVGIAGRAPTETAVGIGMMGLSQTGPKVPDPKKLQAAQLMQRQAQLFKKGSSMYSVTDEDLHLQEKIRSGLEKNSAQIPLPGFGKRLGEMTEEQASKFLRSVKREMAEEARDSVPAGGLTVEALRDALGMSKKQVQRRDMKIGGPDGWRPEQLLLAGLALGTGATVAGMGGIAVSKGVGGIGELVHRAGRERHLNAMLKADPDLAKHPKSEVRKAFSVVHRASPYVAKEPLLAASTVRSIVEAPRSDYGSDTPNVSYEAVKRVLELENSRQGTRYPFMQETNAPGAVSLDKATGLLG